MFELLASIHKDGGERRKAGRGKAQTSAKKVHK